MAWRPSKKYGDLEESALVENMHSSGDAENVNTPIKRAIASKGGEQYGSTKSLESSMAINNLKENGKKYKRKKRLEQAVIVIAAVLISTVIAVGVALLAINISNNKTQDDPKAKDVSASGMEANDDTENIVTLQKPLLGEAEYVELSQSLSHNNSALYFPNLEYAVFGYNILSAYPLAFGHDPGFTHPIFVVKYEKQKRNADLTYHIPDGIDVVRDTACDTSFSSTVIKDQSELDKSLSVSAEVSGGGFGVKFSASTQYKKDSSVVSSKENVMMLTQAKCQQFFTQVNEFSPPPLHPSFIGWAKKLENTTDDRDYLDFIQYYGTHFLSEVAFGARYMYQFNMTSSSYSYLQSHSINVDVAASMHFIFISGGAKVSVSDSQKQALSDFQQRVTTRTISTGTPPPMDLNATKWANQAFTSPVPIAYSLLPVDQLFTDKFMGHLKVDYKHIRHRLLNIMNVKYRKEVYDRSSSLHCRVVNHAVKLPDSACFHKSFNLMGRQSGPRCHGDCLETQDCLGITYSEQEMEEMPADCQTLYRMSYSEKHGLLASQINQTALKEPRRSCNTYVFPYRQTSNYGMKHPSWLMVNGVVASKVNHVGRWEFRDLENCKSRCEEDMGCVAISSQMELAGANRVCGMFNEAEVDMVQLETSAPSDAMGFIKQCA